VSKARKKTVRRPPVRAAITGVHGYLPPDVLTNAELARMVETSDEWIVQRTGIRERHILKGKGLGTSHMAEHAVRGLLAKTGTAPEEVDFLICATITPDFVFPTSANMICQMAGLGTIGSLDVHAACTGFIYAIAVASQFIETGKFRKIVVVGADKMSVLIDYQDRATCVIFGDGAAAVMLEPSKKYGVIDTVMHSDGRGLPLLQVPAGGSRVPATEESIGKRLQFIRWEGNQVYKIAVARMADSATELMKRNRLSVDDIDWLVPHQANRRIIEATANRLKLPPERVMITIEKYGNTTAATIPLCLWDYENKLRAGDKVFLVAFGGGFTWGGVYLTWAYDPR